MIVHRRATNTHYSRLEHQRWQLEGSLASTTTIDSRKRQPMNNAHLSAWAEFKKRKIRGPTRSYEKLGSLLIKTNLLFNLPLQLLHASLNNYNESTADLLYALLIGPNEGPDASLFLYEFKLLTHWCWMQKRYQTTNPRSKQILTIDSQVFWFANCLK